MPVSATSTTTRRPSARTVAATRPRSVNLTALPTRCRSTRPKASGSRAASASGDSTWTLSSRPFASAAARKRRAASTTAGATRPGAGTSSTRPASSWARSSTDDRVAMSRSPLSAIRSTNSRCSGVASSPARTSEKPRMAVSGVRISWLTFARSAFLRRTPSSAWSCAWRSATSARRRSVTSRKLTTRPPLAARSALQTPSASTARPSAWARAISTGGAAAGCRRATASASRAATRASGCTRSRNGACRTASGLRPSRVAMAGLANATAPAASRTKMASVVARRTAAWRAWTRTSARRARCSSVTSRAVPS